MTGPGPADISRAGEAGAGSEGGVGILQQYVGPFEGSKETGVGRIASPAFSQFPLGLDRRSSEESSSSSLCLCHVRRTRAETHSDAELTTFALCNRLLRAQ